MLVWVLVSVLCSIAESQCSKGCDLALASYYTTAASSNATFVSQVFRSSLNITADTIYSYNKNTMANRDSFEQSVRLNIPFPCNCINGEYLGYVFDYSVKTGDTYSEVAQNLYSNLTTAESLQQNNSYPATNIPDNAELKVPVTCSCGDSSVSKDYGLFITYPLRPGETVESIASATGLNATLLQSYNPGKNFNQGSGLVYIPGKGDFFFFFFFFL
jgi:chitin elicitor receptor kinase 1